MQRLFVPLATVGLTAWFAQTIHAGSPWPTSGEVLNAGVTLAIVWFIQESLRRKGELERVPLAAVNRVCDRVDELIAAAVDAAERADSDAAILTCRSLANELNWQRRVAETFGDKGSPRMQEQLNAYFDFKRHLTDSPVSLGPASILARAMRNRNLAVQWALSERVMKNPSQIAKL